MSRREGALVAVLVIVWIPGLVALAEVYRTVDYASHGFLVPLVALWAAAAHLGRLAEQPARPLPGGVLALAACLVAYLLALAVDDPTWLGLVWVATVCAGVLALRGLDGVRTLAFPLAYLLFMVPLPADVVTPVIVRLQILVSSVAVAILQATGVPILREGNVLELPGGTSLFVAEACSGITSLITLLPIAVLIAYFTESDLWRRGVLVLAVGPIALAGNLLRVLLTVGVAMRFDVERATHGPLHEWAGVGTYVIGCLLLLALGSLMRRIWPPPHAVPSP